MNVLHIEQLLYYCRCLFSVLELDARYKWQVMTPNTHHSLCKIIHLCTYKHNLKTTGHTKGKNSLSLQWFFCSRVVFLCFYFCLCFCTCTGPSLLVVKFDRKFYPQQSIKVFVCEHFLSLWLSCFSHTLSIGYHFESAQSLVKKYYHTHAS